MTTAFALFAAGFISVALVLRLIQKWKPSLNTGWFLFALAGCLASLAIRFGLKADYWRGFGFLTVALYCVIVAVMKFQGFRKNDGED
jgi:hypothetical protein